MAGASRFLSKISKVIVGRVGLDCSGLDAR